jgi:hypothetical protein
MNLSLSVRQINAVLLGVQLIISVLVFISLKLHALNHNWFSLAVVGIVYLLALIFFAIIHFKTKEISPLK